MSEPNQTSDKPDSRQKDKGDGRSPIILLVLAFAMMILAILAYVFEDALFDVTYDYSLFVAALVIPVVLGLFFLYAYSNPSLRDKLLGRRRTVIRRSQNVSGVTYNVFGAETVGDVKATHARRKSARHLRKKLARKTPPPAGVRSEDQDAGPDEKGDA